MKDREEEMIENPYIAIHYMLTYNHQWRGGQKAKNITTAHVQNILDFLDKYFDICIDGRTFFPSSARGAFRKCLKNIENDMKIDAKD